MDHFKSKNVASSQFWIDSKNFFLIFHNEKGQQVDKSHNTGLRQKKFFRTNGPFCARKWHILITPDQL